MVASVVYRGLLTDEGLDELFEPVLVLGAYRGQRGGGGHPTTHMLQQALDAAEYLKYAQKQG